MINRIVQSVEEGIFAAASVTPSVPDFRIVCVSRHIHKLTCPVRSQKSTIPTDQMSVALVARHDSPEHEALTRSGAQYLRSTATPPSRGGVQTYYYRLIQGRHPKCSLQHVLASLIYH